MPHLCSVPNCRSNYKSEPSKYSVFRFPTNLELRRKWLSAIKRDDFVPNEHSRVCELHFKSEEVERSTKFYSNTGDFYNVPLVQPRLIKNAIPSKFPGCPQYMRKTVCSRESPESKRLRLENDCLRKAIDESLHTQTKFIQEQALISLDDIFTKFVEKKNIINWTFFRTQNFVTFTNIAESPNPKVTYLVSINGNMDVRVEHKGIELNTLKLGTQNIKFPAKINTCHFLENILSSLISRQELTNVSSNDPLREKITIVANLLDSMIALIPERRLSLLFFKEQINLIDYNNKRRAIRYSYETLLFSSLFLAISPHAYKFVRNYTNRNSIK